MTSRTITATTGKKKYSSPKLVKHGSMERMTQGNKSTSTENPNTGKKMP